MKWNNLDSPLGQKEDSKGAFEIRREDETTLEKEKTNLIANGDFGDGLNNWNPINLVVGENESEGYFYLKASNGAGIYQNVELLSNRTYKLSFDVLSVHGFPSQVTVEEKIGDGSTKIIVQETYTNKKLARQSITFSTNNTTSYLVKLASTENARVSFQYVTLYLYTT